MEHTTYASRLRYLDADDVDDSVVDFDGLDVRAVDGDKLGDLDGFLLEPSGRLLYLVVDSGGWFRSRRFLVPAEQASVDRDARALRLGLSRGSLERYPEFDEDRFGHFSDDEFHAYHSRLAASAGLTGSSASASDSTSYRHPEWWRSSAVRTERLRPIESRSFIRRTSTGAPASSLSDQGERHTHGSVTHSHPGGDRPHTHEDERELVTARDRDEHRPDHDDRHEHGGRDRDDASPHFAGRAQPGDVLGIETGGETTGVGDTAEDENKRRRTAERTGRVER